MDEKPFFIFNLIELRENHFLELAKFRKNFFNVENVLTTASELKYTNEIKNFLTQQWDEPNEEFIKFVLSDVYQGVKTKKVIDNFRDIVKKSLNQFVNEKVNDKLQKALSSTDGNETDLAEKINEEVASTNEEELIDELEKVADEPIIVTTEEEIEGYVLIKLMLKESIDASRVYYRDNKSYFNVLLDDNIRKWICRLGFNTSNKYIQLNDELKTTHRLESVNDILLYKDEILRVSKQFN